jgi:cytochrome c oxidase subunit 2
MFAAQIVQSVLEPAGPQAAAIYRLWWLMFWISAAVFAIVMAVLGAAVVRARQRRGHWRDTPVGSNPDASDLARERADQPALSSAVAVAVGITAITLFALLVASIWTGRVVASLGASSAVSIDVTGHQWWWEVEYEDATPSQRVRTANELHIPVGRPVVLKVTSHDVIHSFWVPSLHGKRDLIPGYTTALWIQADKPGVYRGQCAEFCGHQHAKMAMYVTAESEADYQKWLGDQRREAPEPKSDVEHRGRDVFLSSTCTNCHAIRGTIAGATFGPDLTHVGSRGSIAAGMLPNTPGHLAGWILDSQGIKPGNRMPPNAVSGNDLQALLAYLESLK